jgi:hypothetical protein
VNSSPSVAFAVTEYSLWLPLAALRYASAAVAPIWIDGSYLLSSLTVTLR